jgi:hypothetical protein
MCQKTQLEEAGCDEHDRTFLSFLGFNRLYLTKFAPISLIQNENENVVSDYCGNQEACLLPYHYHLFLQEKG